MTSRLLVDKIEGKATSGSINIPNHIINVTQAVKTDTQTATGFTFVDITGLSVTVNPVSTSSKFFINFLVRGASDYYTSYVRLLRDSTELGANADGSADSRLRIASAKVTDQTQSNSHGIVHDHNFQIVDEPNTTSALTYKLQMAGRLSSNVMYVNRSHPDRTENEYDFRSISMLQVFEIGG